MTLPCPRALALLGALAMLCCTASPIFAQYMYLDTNGDGLHSVADIVQQNGVTTVDVYLRTNANRAGEPVICNVDDRQPLSIYSYTIVLLAEGGTVQWQPFQDRMSFPVPLAAGTSPSELLAGFRATSLLPAGTYVLGHVELTVASGAPRLAIVPTTSFNYSDTTNFGSSCFGQNFDGTMRLGVDWLEADGALNPADQPPVLSPILDMVVDAGSVATQLISATDPEGQAVELEKSAGPNYMTVSIDGSAAGTTSGTIRLAPPFDAGRVDTAVVRASDGVAAVTDTFLIHVRERFSAASLNGYYNMRVVAGQTAIQTVNAHDSDGDASEISFELVSGPSYVSVATLALVTPSTAQGEIRVSPGLGDVGTSLLTFVALKGTLRAEGTIGIAVLQTAPANTAPSIAQMPDVLVPPNTQRVLGVSSRDPDGDVLTIRALLGPEYMQFYPYGFEGGATGTMFFNPTIEDLGTAQVVIGVADGYVETRSSFTVTVAYPNHAPVPDPGGPYQGTVGQLIAFDGSGSTDPDGDALAYVWFFGDGVVGGGARPEHAYAAPSTYTVMLFVDDARLRVSATTTATITDLLSARAFTLGGARSVPLAGSSRSYLSVFLEPVESAYRNENLDAASLVMRSDSTGLVNEVHAESGKAVRINDRDHNGVDEVELRFATADLAALFSDTQGRTQVGVTIECSLQSGAHLRAPLSLNVIPTGGAEAVVRVYPNPLNPSGILGVVTTVAGPLDVRLFDVNGRQVRVLTREGWVPAGYREVAIDGRGAKGAPLASGVYYYRVKSVKSVLNGRLTIAR